MSPPPQPSVGVEHVWALSPWQPAFPARDPLRLENVNTSKEGRGDSLAV